MFLCRRFLDIFVASCFIVRVADGRPPSIQEQMI